MGGMDWIDVAHDRGRWRALVNLVMNLSVSITCGISGLAEIQWASPAGLCFMMQVSKDHYSKTIIITIPMYTLNCKCQFENILFPRFCITVWQNFNIVLRNTFENLLYFLIKTVVSVFILSWYMRTKTILHHRPSQTIYEILSLTSFYSCNSWYNSRVSKEMICGQKHRLPH
jgi:hypothetical protein